MESDGFDKLIKSWTRSDAEQRRQSLWRRTLSFIDNINKKPPPTQMAVGGATGLCVGYIFTRTSKTAATALGISLIVFQVCNYRGYVKLNRSRFEKDLRDLRKGLEKNLLGKSESVIPDAEEMGNFIVSNAWLLSGFAAGWLIGFGIA